MNFDLGFVFNFHRDNLLFHSYFLYQEKKEKPLSLCHPISSISKIQKIMGLEGKQMFASYDRMLWILTVFFSFFHFLNGQKCLLYYPNSSPSPNPQVLNKVPSETNWVIGRDLDASGISIVYGSRRLNVQTTEYNGSSRGDGFCP